MIHRVAAVQMIRLARKIPATTMVVIMSATAPTVQNFTTTMHKIKNETKKLSKTKTHHTASIIHSETTTKIIGSRFC